MRVYKTVVLHGRLRERETERVRERKRERKGIQLS
jgi:hypothetical protein